MSFKVIYNTDTLAILVVNPAEDGEGNVTLPDGVNADVATLNDSQLTVLETANAQFTLNEDLDEIIATDAGTDPQAEKKAAIMASAVAIEGVDITTLNQTQMNLITGCLLYLAGGLNDDLTVKDLEDWIL